ncbi:MAG: AgmX/PglI C-terminal domain-containing protein [Bradymonadia bacterium]
MKIWGAIALLLIAIGGLWWLNRPPGPDGIPRSGPTAKTETQPATANRPAPSNPPELPSPAHTQRDVARPQPPLQAPAEDKVMPGGDPQAAPKVAETDVAEDAEKEAQPLDEAAEGDVEEAMIWSLDKEGVVGAMKEIKPHIEECYDGWAKRTEDPIEGRVAIQFTIDAPDVEEGSDTEAAQDRPGQIKAVKIVQSDLDHSALEGCIVNSIEGVKFQAPESGEPLEVTYPFLLEPGEEEP